MLKWFRIRNTFSTIKKEMISPEIIRCSKISNFNRVIYQKKKKEGERGYRLRRLLQPISSSPRGQSRLPSHSPDLDMQTLLSLHLNDCDGQRRRPVHSSSEPSAQSARPSQTKNQLMQLPVDRH